MTNFRELDVLNYYFLEKLSSGDMSSCQLRKSRYQEYFARGIVC